MALADGQVGGRPDRPVDVFDAIQNATRFMSTVPVCDSSIRDK